MPAPSGTVSFLFTDIEGSTLRWERDRAAMQAALRRHDTLVRLAIETNCGIVFKTIGDAFCAVFDRPDRAARAAVAAQIALNDEDFSGVGGIAARMAIHTGTTDERDGDYFGPTVNRVARLLSIAHGGQVLLSDVAASIVGSELGRDTTLLAMGEHRLKDLADSIRVFQLVAPGLRSDFPPLRSLGAFKHNLAQQLTRFIGRESDVREIENLIAANRLVTLAGSGGIGKTRVALQVAAELLDGSGDGVWFVDLAPLENGRFVISEIASIFGVPQRTDDARTLEAIVEFLQPRRLLIILDNCEHVLSDVRNAAKAILRAAPDVRILATTREVLNVAGEHVYRLPPLGVPSNTGTVSARSSLAYGAVALFVDRAMAADSRFVLSDEAAPSVVEICGRLDGIPLALELAAARVKTLGIRNLSTRLDERLRLLTGGNRAALPRQQTIRALIDWSYDLLSDDERKLLRRLAAFAGGWTLDAAEAVCADATLDPFDVLDLHSSLIDKSLVVAEAVETDPRFRLLETTRAYARERLQLAGEEDETAARHARFFEAFSKRMFDESALGNSGEPWLRAIRVELANVRVALEWALGPSGSTETAVRIIKGGLCGYWWFTTKNEGLRWIERTLQRIDAERSPEFATSMYRLLGSFADAKRSVEAQRASMEILERTGSADFSLIGITSQMLATALHDLDMLDDAYAAIVRAREAFRRGSCENTHRYAATLAAHATILRSLGRLTEARDLAVESTNLFTRLGDELAVSAQNTEVAEIDFARGFAHEARVLAERSASASKRLGALNHAENAIVLAAACRYVLGDLAGARDAARDALETSLAREDLDGNALVVLAAIAAANDDAARGARLLGFVERLRERHPMRRSPSHQKIWETVDTLLHERCDAAALRSWLHEGAQLSERQVVAEALEI